MQTILFLFFGIAITVNGWTDEYFLQEPVGKTVFIPMAPAPSFTRSISVTREQIYRVCNGKNKNTCGFWEDVKTKKKVASGVTTYNKEKKQLVIKNLKTSDSGVYHTKEGIGYTVIAS